MLRAIEDGSGITKITTTLAGPPTPCAKLGQAVSSIRRAMFRQALAEHPDPRPSRRPSQAVW
ncbi:hypothetical protein [Streptomyces sp. C10-9-1]|uniref:hypothetical protein n=1 Tax=Streptomyces sp. C10-9-1 TaxID=1859285 RepID=UPI003F4A6985